MGTERPNLEDEPGETDDAILEDTAVLQAIEHERREVPVADPAQVDLSEIAADTARDLQDEATRERAVTEKLADD